MSITFEGQSAWSATGCAGLLTHFISLNWSSGEEKAHCDHDIGLKLNLEKSRMINVLTNVVIGMRSPTLTIEVSARQGR